MVEPVITMLEGMEHKVRTERSGNSALGVFPHDPDVFDLVITDVPDTSGLLPVERLRGCVPT